MKPNPRSPRLSRRALLLAAFASSTSFSVVPLAHAADTVYTNGSAAGAVSGNWSAVTWTKTGTTTTNTFPGGASSDAGNVAQNLGTLNATTSATTVLDVPLTIGALYVGSQGTTVANWTINTDGNSANFITLNGTGMGAGNNVYGNAGVAALATRSGGTLTVNPNIVLASNADFGTTSPQNGNLVVNGNVTASTSATLAFRGSGSAPQANINGTITINGNIGASGSTIAVSNLRSSSSGTIGAVTINGVLGASVSSLTQNGAATMTLNAANTYTGATTITSGTLALGAGGSLASTSIVNNATFDVSARAGSYALGTGQTLSGTGTVVGGATIQGTLTPGTGIGAITFNGNLTLAGSTQLEISGVNRGVTGGYDGVNIGAGAYTLTYGGALNLVFNSTLQAGVYDLFQLGAGAAQASNFGSIGATGSAVGSLNGVSITSGTGWTGTLIDSASKSWLLSFNNGTGDLTISASAIPEPSTYAALAGLGMLALAAARRRKLNRK